MYQANNIKIDKNQQIEKLKNYHPHSVSCIFTTMALYPVPPAFAMVPHTQTSDYWQTWIHTKPSVP